MCLILKLNIQFIILKGSPACFGEFLESFLRHKGFFEIRQFYEETLDFLLNLRSSFRAIKGLRQLVIVLAVLVYGLNEHLCLVHLPDGLCSVLGKYTILLGLSLLSLGVVPKLSDFVGDIYQSASTVED